MADSLFIGFPAPAESTEAGTILARIRYLSRRRTTPALGQIRGDARQQALAYRNLIFPRSDELVPPCQWTSIGPRNINGRVRTLAVDPTNRQVIFAGTAGGGLWKSEDAGQSWTFKALTLPSADLVPLSIGSIAVDPSPPTDPNAPHTLYVGTGEPFCPRTSDLLMAGDYEGTGVYKSIDGGDTWTRTAIDNAYIFRIAVDPFNPQILLCAGYSNNGSGGLCRSTDAGATWTTILTGNLTDVVFDPGQSGVVYTGKGGKGPSPEDPLAPYPGEVLQSTDHGASWTSIPGLGDAAPSSADNLVRRVCLATGHSTVSPNRVYAKVIYGTCCGDCSTCLGQGEQGIYRLEPGSPAFTRIANDPEPAGSKCGGWWASFIEADPQDTDIVYAGGIDLARSENGGTTWKMLTIAGSGTGPVVHVDQHALAFGSTHETLYLANDGGVFRGDLTGSGANLHVDWTKVSTGLVITQFYKLGVSSASPAFYGGGTQDNGTLLTSGGLSWRHVLGGDGGCVVFPPPSEGLHTLFAESFDGANRIWWDDDGGLSPEEVFSSADYAAFPSPPLALDPADPTRLFYGTDRLRKTNDAGAWIQAPGIPTLSDPDCFTAIAISPSDPQVIYAGTQTGRLYRYFDDDASSSNALIGPSFAAERWLSGIVVDSESSGDIVYISFLQYQNGGGDAADQVWKGSCTANCDNPSSWSWSPLVTNLSNAPASAIVMDPSKNLYVATDVGVYRLAAGTTSWTPFDSGLPVVPVVDLALDNSATRLRAATHGRGVYEIRLNTTCPPVDLLVRDNELDIGDEPSAEVENPMKPGDIVRHYQSADIKVDSPPYQVVDGPLDGVEFDAPDHPYLFSASSIRSSPAHRIEYITGIEHEHPVRTATNRVYVQVHNRGFVPATSVRVKLLYTEVATTLPLLPVDFWTAYPGDAFNQSDWKPIGTQMVSEIRPATPVVLSFDWTPPASAPEHACLLAMIDAEQDPLDAQGVRNVDVLARSNKHVGQKNVHVVGPSAAVTFKMRNTGPRNTPFRLRMHNIAEAIDELLLVLPQLPAGSLQGVVQLGATQAQRDSVLDAAVRAGTCSVEIAALVRSQPNPVVLRLNRGAASAEMTGISIAPNSSIPVVVGYRTRATTPPPTRLFLVDQMDSLGKVLGGSEYVLRHSPDDGP